VTGTGGGDGETDTGGAGDGGGEGLGAVGARGVWTSRSSRLGAVRVQPVAIKAPMSQVDLIDHGTTQACRVIP
jgi:hypothetical protein